MQCSAVPYRRVQSQYRGRELNVSRRPATTAASAGELLHDVYCVCM